MEHVFSESRPPTRLVLESAEEGSLSSSLTLADPAAYVQIPSGKDARSSFALWISPLAMAISLAVYIATLAPTVTSEDSGELIGAAYFWGVAHPPGYPLWTIFSGLFLRLVPLCNVAWRCNLFSAVCSAVGIGLFAATLTRLRLRPAAVLAAALTCAFGSVLWSQSVITEVYSLHFLITILIIWCGLKWESGYNQGWLILASLSLGLGMSNHQTVGYTGVAVAGWVLVYKPGLLKNWRLVLASTLAFVAGLMPYIYIVARANANPPVNWGNAQTVSGWWDHVSRHQYRPAASSAQNTTKESWLKRKQGQLGLIAWYCTREYTSALLAAAIPGLFIMLARRNRRFCLLWALLVCCYIALHIWATDFDFDTRVERWCNQVFHIPLYACIAIPIAFSLDGALGLLHRSAVLTTFCSVALVITVPAITLIFNFGQNNMRHYCYADDHARNLLDSMLPNAIIFPSGDHNTFPLIFKVLVEKYRPDVSIADKYGYIDLDLYREMPDNPGKPKTLGDRDRIEEWVIRNAKRPVYYTVNRPSLIPGAKMVQTGILYHLLPEGRTIDQESPWAKIRYRNMEGVTAPRDLGADNILADYAFFQGLRELGHRNRSKALQHFADCVTYAAGMKEMFNNTGSALAEFGLEEEAIRYYASAAALDPVYSPPRWNLARIHKKRREYHEAEQVFVELSHAEPQDFRIWGELAFLAARANRTQKAISLWQKSLTLNPNQPQIIEQLYHSYFPTISTRPASQPQS